MSTTATPLDVIEGRARWCVVEGDNAEVLPTLPEKSVAHVITDPPYLGARGDSWEGDRVPLSLPYEPATEKMLSDLVVSSARLMRRWCLVFNDFAGDAALRRAWTGLDVSVCFQPIVWVKPPGAFAPNGSAYSLPKQVEFITAARCRRITGRPIPGAYVSAPYSPSTEILRTGGKPLALMLSIIGDFTEPGDVVLDPFAGAGTTGVACLRLGRRFIGIEKDARYAAIARERLAAESQGLTLRDARAGQTSLLGGGL